MSDALLNSDAGKLADELERITANWEAPGHFPVDMTKKAAQTVISALRALASPASDAEPVAWMLPEGPGNLSGSPKIFTNKGVIELMKIGGYDDLIPLYAHPPASDARDAARCRWLRENLNSEEVSVVFHLSEKRFDYGTAKHAHAFDQAIDTAIAGAKRAVDIDDGQPPREHE